MDGTYGLQHSTVGDYSDDKALMSPENLILPTEYQLGLLSSETFRLRFPIFGSEELLNSEAAEIQRDEQHNMSTLIKAKIASHPCYPRLLQAYIDCQKVKSAFPMSLCSQVNAACIPAVVLKQYI